MELLNVKAIYIGIVVVIFLLIVPFGHNRFKNKRNKVNIANTKYVKSLPYYKKMKLKYFLYALLVIISFTSVFLSASFLVARLVKVDEVIHEKQNRDIFLSLDVSGSCYSVDVDIVKQFKEIIKKLDGDRVGFMVFDSTPVLLSPLTDDYDYLLNIMDIFIKSYGEGGQYTDEVRRYREYIFSGTTTFSALYGASLIGDGLVSCIDTFVNSDNYNEEIKNSDRTRIIILATDNQSGRGSVFTLEEATAYAAKKKIKVIGIFPGVGTPTTYLTSFQSAIGKTKGKVYLYNGNNNNNSAASIVNDIMKTNKSVLKTEKEILQTDMPVKSFIVLLSVFGVFILFTRRVIV